MMVRGYGADEALAGRDVIQPDHGVSGRSYDVVAERVERYA